MEGASSCVMRRCGGNWWTGTCSNALQRSTLDKGLKKKREGVPTSMWVSDLRGTICVEVLLWLSVCCLGHTQKADEEGHSLEENEYASDTTPVNSS